MRLKGPARGAIDDDKRCETNLSVSDGRMGWKKSRVREVGTTSTEDEK